MREQISPVLSLKMEAEFVTVSRRDLGYPVLTDYLPFQISLSQRWSQVAEIAFLSPKCLEGFFSSKAGEKKKMVVLSVVKALPA